VEGEDAVGGMEQFQQRQAERSALITHLLEPDEEVIDTGLAQSVEIAERTGRGGGEGLLYLTNRRLIFRLDQGGGCAEVRLANLTGVKVKWISVPQMSRFVVAYKDNAVPYTANYYLGTKFGKQLRTAIKRL
jgi:hypothetical protein